MTHTPTQNIVWNSVCEVENAQKLPGRYVTSARDDYPYQPLCLLVHLRYWTFTRITLPQHTTKISSVFWTRPMLFWTHASAEGWRVAANENFPHRQSQNVISPRGFVPLRDGEGNVRPASPRLIFSFLTIIPTYHVCANLVRWRDILELGRVLRTIRV